MTASRSRMWISSVAALYMRAGDDPPPEGVDPDPDEEPGRGCGEVGSFIASRSYCCSVSHVGAPATCVARTPADAACAVTAAADGVVLPRIPAKGGILNGNFTTADTASP